MKRRVLSLFLAFALCFSSLPLSTSAEETDVVTEQEETESVEEQEAEENEEVAVQTIGELHEAHPICGDPDCTEEDHQLPAGEEWTAISSFAEMKAAMHKEQSTAKAGYYYLTNDITWSWDRDLWLTDGITLCLNGHSIIASPTHQCRKIQGDCSCSG